MTTPSELPAHSAAFSEPHRAKPLLTKLLLPGAGTVADEFEQACIKTGWFAGPRPQPTHPALSQHQSWQV